MLATHPGRGVAADRAHARVLTRRGGVRGVVRAGGPSSARGGVLALLAAALASGGGRTGRKTTGVGVR